MSKIVKIVSSQNNIFAEEFLQEYLNRGFGSLSKRDIDILVMHLLMKHADLKSVSNFDLSMKLKLTEMKIKNLKYEANLKYSINLKESIEENFLSLLKNAKLKVVGKETWISLVVEDTFLKSAIKAKVKDNGSFTDSSFNSEIVKISAEDFSFLMASYSNKEDQKDFENKILDLFPEIDSGISFMKLFKIFLEKVAGSAGNEVGKQGVILGVSYLTGGTSVLGQIFDTLKSIIEPIDSS